MKTLTLSAVVQISVIAGMLPTKVAASGYESRLVTPLLSGIQMNTELATKLTANGLVPSAVAGQSTFFLPRRAILAHQYQLWQANGDTGVAQPVPGAPVMAEALSLASDGTSIWFIHEGALWRAQGDGSSAASQTLSPGVSLSGTPVACRGRVYAMGALNQTQRGLYIHDIAAGTGTLHTGVAGNGTTFRWADSVSLISTADRVLVTFYSGTANRYEIHTVEPSASPAAKFLTHGQPAASQSVGDGRELLLAAGRRVPGNVSVPDSYAYDIIRTDGATTPLPAAHLVATFSHSGPGANAVSFGAVNGGRVIFLFREAEATAAVNGLYAGIAGQPGALRRITSFLPNSWSGCSEGRVAYTSQYGTDVSVTDGSPGIPLLPAAPEGTSRRLIGPVDTGVLMGSRTSDGSASMSILSGNPGEAPQPVSLPPDADLRAFLADIYGVPAAGGAWLVPWETADTGREPWLIRRQGARVTADINPGRSSSSGSAMDAAAGSRIIYHTAKIGPNYIETTLHSTEGYGAGDKLMDLPSGLRVAGAASSGSQCYLSTNGNSGSYYVTNGTPAGTLLLGTVNGVAGTVESRSGRALFFPWINTVPVPFYSLYLSNGTVPGTGPATGFSSANSFSRLGAAGDYLYFLKGTERWTCEVSSGVTAPRPVGPGGTPAVYAADGLWRTDGTDAGSFRLLPGEFGVALEREALWWCAGRLTPGGNWQLCRSDASVNGTVTLAEIAPPGEPVPLLLAVLDGGRVLFRRGVQLWVSDGTEQGTQRLGGTMVLDASGSAAWDTPDDGQAAEFNSRWFFPGTTAATGREVWFTDGTVAGTMLAEDYSPGAASTLPVRFVVAGGVLYYQTERADGIGAIRALRFTSAQSFESWASAHGLTGADALPDASPARDGVNNFIKYAFNLDPASASAAILSPGSESGLPRLESFLKDGAPWGRLPWLRRAGSDLVYTPQSSSDLTSWHPGTDWSVVDVAAVPGSAFEHCSVEFRILDAYRYFRVKVTGP